MRKDARAWHRPALCDGNGDEDPAWPRPGGGRLARLRPAAIEPEIAPAGDGRRDKEPGMAAGSSAHDRSGRPDGTSGSSGTYFRRPSPFKMVLIVAGLGYYGWAVISPSTIPYDYLGPLSTLTKYLVKNHNTLFQLGYVIAWMVHIGEAFYALKLCKAKGITDGSTQFWWVVQTFLFGIASLHFLLQYEPQRKHE